MGSARLGSALRKTTSSGSDLAFPTEDEVGSRKARSWRGHATKCHHTVATPGNLVARRPAHNPPTVSPLPCRNPSTRPPQPSDDPDIVTVECNVLQPTPPTTPRPPPPSPSPTTPSTTPHASATTPQTCTALQPFWAPVTHLRACLSKFGAIWRVSKIVPERRTRIRDVSKTCQKQTFVSKPYP